MQKKNTQKQQILNKARFKPCCIYTNEARTTAGLMIKSGVQNMYLFFKKVSVNVCLSVCLWEEKHFPMTNQRKTASNSFLTMSFKYLRNNYKNESENPPPSRHITKTMNECFVLLR